MGNALVIRIFKLIAERKARDEAAPTTAAAKNSLIVLDQVVALYEQLHPDATNGKSSSFKVTKSAKDLAETVGLHRQAGHTKQTLLA